MKIQTAPVTETNKVVVVSAVGCRAIDQTVSTSESNNGPEKAGETSQYSRFSYIDSSAGNLPAFDIGAMSAALIAAITIIFGCFYFGPKSAPEEKNPISEDTVEPAFTGSYIESFLSLDPLNVIYTIVTIVSVTILSVIVKTVAAATKKKENAQKVKESAKAECDRAVLASFDADIQFLTAELMSTLQLGRFEKYKKEKSEYCQNCGDDAGVDDVANETMMILQKAVAATTEKKKAAQQVMDSAKADLEKAANDSKVADIDLTKAETELTEAKGFLSSTKTQNAQQVMDSTKAEFEKAVVTYLQASFDFTKALTTMCGLKVRSVFEFTSKTKDYLNAREAAVEAVVAAEGNEKSANQLRNIAKAKFEKAVFDRLKDGEITMVEAEQIIQTKQILQLKSLLYSLQCLRQYCYKNFGDENFGTPTTPEDASWGAATKLLNKWAHRETP